MRIAAAWMAGLAAWMGTLSLVLWLWTSDELPPALLTGAAIALAAIALYAALVSELPAQRRLPESGLPTVAIVFGLAMMVNGLALSPA